MADPHRRARRGHAHRRQVGVVGLRIAQVLVGRGRIERDHAAVDPQPQFVVAIGEEDLVPALAADAGRRRGPPVLPCPGR